VTKLLAKMSSPVLEEIKTILVAVYPDTFPTDKCLGTNKDLTKCGKYPMDRTSAAQRMEYLVSLGEVPHDKRFYKKVREFLAYSHCHHHQNAVFVKFENWKTERGDRATSTPTSPVVDENPNEDQSGANPLAPNPVAQTPKKTTDGETTNDDEQDTNSDIFSSTTISPSQESENAFSTISPASTALTTPAQTPFEEDPTSKRLDAFGDAESYPGTPSRVARKPSESVMEPAEAANKELDDVLDQHSDQGTEGLGRISRRFKSVKTKNWPLLKAIESKFTDMDNKKGRVYVWTHETIKGVVKIGFTAEGSTPRHKQAGNCYATDTKRQWESSEPFIGAFRVETIVRYNLRDKNIDLKSCSQCNKAHKEWFKMEWMDAVKSIETWTEFVTRAYKDGRLSEEGEQIMNDLCKPRPENFLDALAAKNIGPVQDEELTGLSMVSEESEAGQQTSILEERVSGLASDEQTAVTVNTAPSPPSTSRLSSDTSPDQSAALPPTGQGPSQKGFKEMAKGFVRQVGTMMKTRRRHTGRSDSSEQADGERRDGNEELVPKLFRLFHFAELKEGENVRNHSQSDAADARDEAPLLETQSKRRLRSHSKAA
jgi:hypothetical protein